MLVMVGDSGCSSEQESILSYGAGGGGGAWLMVGTDSDSHSKGALVTRNEHNSPMMITWVTRLLLPAVEAMSLVSLFHSPGYGHDDALPDPSSNGSRNHKSRRNLDEIESYHPLRAIPPHSDSSGKPKRDHSA